MEQFIKQGAKKMNDKRSNRGTYRQETNPYQQEEYKKFEINGFYNNGSILVNLISDVGEANVKELSEFFYKRKGEQDKEINASQLRKFYDSFLKIYFSETDDDNKKVQLLMLKAQLFYANTRLRLSSFTKIMANRIHLVVSSSNADFKKNLDAFKFHFEAIVGYFPKK